MGLSKCVGRLSKCVGGLFCGNFKDEGVVFLGLSKHVEGLFDGNFKEEGIVLFGVNFKIKLNLVIGICKNVLEDCIICIWLFYCGNSYSWQIVSVRWGPRRQDLWLFLATNSKISSSSSSLFPIQFQFYLISLSHPNTQI